MHVSEATYAISGQAQAVLEKLQTMFSVNRERIPRHTRIFYDTFDWRLFRHGSALAMQDIHSRACVRWEPIPIDNVPSHGLSHDWYPISDSAPGFAWDLPRDRQREVLMSIVEMRRLLPVVKLEIHGQLLHILNKSGKTILRISIEQGKAQVASSHLRAARLVEVLRVNSIHSDKKSFRRIRRVLERDLGLIPVSGGVLSQALAAIGRQPCDYSSELQLNLKSDMSAATAMRAICMTLLEIMRVNEAGIRDNLDTEFLHDFRVAVRRTRTAFSQLKQVLPDEIITPFYESLAWLRKITGPTRDLDRYLLNINTYKSGLSKTVRDDLKPLCDFLQRQQRQEHRQMVKALDTPQYRQAVRAWSQFLKEADTDYTDTTNAQRPIRNLASNRIWQGYRRLYKNGQIIIDGAHAGQLHRLDKQSKKLYDLMAFFQSLYPSDDIEPLSKTVKQLHDRLGAFNDYEEQKQALKSFADRMMTEKKYPYSTFMAMEIMVKDFEQRQAVERSHVQKCFSQFTRRRNQKRFKKLFKRK